MRIPGAGLATSAATVVMLLLGTSAAALAEPGSAAADRSAARESLALPQAPQRSSSTPGSPSPGMESPGTDGSGQARRATAATAPAPLDRGVTAAGVGPGRYVVVYKPGRHPVTATPARLGVRALRSYSRAVRGLAATLDAAQLAAVRSDPAVASVEPDRVVHASST